MKVAFSGKGGVGKTTIAAAVIEHALKKGSRVFAIDADMDPNLPGALGFDQPITPISEMKDLMQQRMEVDKSAPGMYKLNPFVADIPEKYAVRRGNLTLVVLGAIDRGGSGCACPENAFLRNLMSHIVISESDWVVLDMEAGVEHMGRATAKSVDAMIIVAEPTPKAVQTVLKVRELGKDIGVERIAVVGNKIRVPADLEFLRARVAPLPIAGWLPFLEGAAEIERGGRGGFAELVPGQRIEELVAGIAALVGEAKW